jgi:hypothetical protein
MMPSLVDVAVGRRPPGCWSPVFSLPVCYTEPWSWVDPCRDALLVTSTSVVAVASGSRLGLECVFETNPICALRVSTSVACVSCALGCAFALTLPIFSWPLLDEELLVSDLSLDCLDSVLLGLPAFFMVSSGNSDVNFELFVSFGPCVLGV